MNCFTDDHVNVRIGIVGKGLYPTFALLNHRYISQSPLLVVCDRNDTMLNFFLLFTTEIIMILNHSCDNNLSKYFLGDVIVVQACKNIKEGEEV